MTVLPVFYLAPLNYYSVLLKQSDILFEVREHFIKQSYRNRCTIYGANGKLNLIIPTRHPGDRTPLKEVKIAHDFNWQKTHWKSIETAYRSSAYFEFYEHIFAPYYEKKFDFLIDFNFALQQEVFKILEIQPPPLTNVSLSFQDKYPEGNDLRNFFSLKQNRAGMENVGKIPNAGIPSYTQVFSGKYGFLPDLSIIDLIFNLGTNSVQYLRS